MLPRVHSFRRGRRRAGCRGLTSYAQPRTRERIGPPLVNISAGHHFGQANGGTSVLTSGLHLAGLGARAAVLGRCERASPRHRSGLLKVMVELMGIEPTASSMPRKRSPSELQPLVPPVVYHRSHPSSSAGRPAGTAGRLGEGFIGARL